MGNPLAGLKERKGAGFLGDPTDLPWDRSQRSLN